MRLLLKTYFILLTALALYACGEEEYVYPDLITEMVCLETDGEGFGIRFTTDQGTLWHLREGNRPDSLTADSTYRMVFRYEAETESEATLYSIQQVIAPLPLPESHYETICTDPVTLQSIWQSGNYLNMVLQVMVKDTEHEMSFVENGITAHKDGTQTLTLTLYHDRKGDIEAFEQKVYLSVPLWHYRHTLNKGDSIVFQLNTYKEGTTSRTFIY